MSHAYSHPFRADTMLAVTLGFGSYGSRTSAFATTGTSQSLNDLLERRIPTGDCRESSRLSNSNMPALTFEREYVLPEIIGQLDDRQRRARWHHGLYIHTAML